MTALENWQEQRTALAKELKDQREISDILYSVRHALMQTEQNTLAAQTDDVLRQQLGVLFGLLKNSVNLLNIPTTATTWTPYAKKKKPRWSTKNHSSCANCSPRSRRFRPTPATRRKIQTRW